MKPGDKQMLCKFLTTCFGTIALCIATTSLSADTNGLLDLMFKENGTFSPFPSKTVQGLMTSREFAKYKTHLENLECDAAETILNTAFVRTYPQHSRAKKTSARHNLNHNRWIAYANSEFMEYGYCDALLAFQVTERKLIARNIPLRIYTPKKLQLEFSLYANRDNISDDQFQIEHREGAIGRIIADADRGFAPAILKIADWLRRGDVFDLSNGKKVEYYLLSRAHHLGASESPQKQRLQELSRSLSENQRRNLDQKATAKQGLITHIIDDMQPF